VKATKNSIVGSQKGMSLNSASGVTANGNSIFDTSNQAISINDNSGGGGNVVTGNAINEGNCGISSGNAASSDVFLPNTVYNMAAAQCH
jgi:hypothetical protein